jgi:hypothetical protein
MMYTDWTPNFLYLSKNKFKIKYWFKWAGKFGSIRRRTSQSRGVKIPHIFSIRAKCSDFMDLSTAWCVPLHGSNSRGVSVTTITLRAELSHLERQSFLGAPSWDGLGVERGRRRMRGREWGWSPSFFFVRSNLRNRRRREEGTGDFSNLDHASWLRGLWSGIHHIYNWQVLRTLHVE